MKKKTAIIKTAIDLFVTQGFDATPTLQIAKETGVTEPLIFYHFKNKDGLFTAIIRSIFDEYFSRLDALPQESATQIEKIEALLTLHLKLVEDIPKETYLIVSTCPARLRDPEHICSSRIIEQRERLITYLTDCVQQGMASGEFQAVPLEATVYLILAFMNGLIRQLSISPYAPGKDAKKKRQVLLQEAIAFCTSRLVK